MTPRAILSLLTIATILATGCATVSGYNFYVEARNTGTEPIPSCTVTSAKGFWHEPGYLGVGFGKSIAGPFKYPYADRWTVSWKTAKGEQMEKTLDLTNAFSKPFQGRLIFSIDANNNVSHSTADFSSR